MELYSAVKKNEIIHKVDEPKEIIESAVTESQKDMFALLCEV